MEKLDGSQGVRKENKGWREDRETSGEGGERRTGRKMGCDWQEAGCGGHKGREAEGRRGWRCSPTDLLSSSRHPGPLAGHHQEASIAQGSLLFPFSELQVHFESVLDALPWIFTHTIFLHLIGYTLFRGWDGLWEHSFFPQLFLHRYRKSVAH